MRALVLGEVLWDVFPDRERLGGAPFNFAAHLRKLQHEVLFISGVGSDDRGRRILDAMAELGLDASGITVREDLPTGHVTVSLDGAGKPDFVIHRPAAYLEPVLQEDLFERIRAWGPDWIYTGTLAQTSSTVRALTAKVAAAFPNAKRFYDVNLRKGCYTRELVRELLEGAWVVKLNEDEAREIAAMIRDPFTTLEAFCRRLRRNYGAPIVCVTRGAQGCAVLASNEYFELAGHDVKVADTVGAGDAFAAGLVHGLVRNWSVWLCAYFANKLGAFVASRPGAIPDWTLNELEDLETL